MKITNDVETYLKTKYSNIQKTLTDCSRRDDGDKTPLIISNYDAICYDDVAKAVCASNNIWATADALIFDRSGKKDEVIFMEFKSGFLDQISKDDMKAKWIKCPEDESKCCQALNDLKDEYIGVFYKKRKIEKEELVLSVKQKIHESIKLFEVFIDSHGPLSVKPIKSKFILVCDTYYLVPPTESHMNIGQMLSQNAAVSGKRKKMNETKSIRKSFDRYKQKDSEENAYFFDDVDVWNTDDFNNSMYCI
ncbi:MAG: hypothetical protein R3Y65_05230 [Bacillota bacterium]